MSTNETKPAHLEFEDADPTTPRLVLPAHFFETSPLDAACLDAHEQGRAVVVNGDGTLGSVAWDHET